MRNMWIIAKRELHGYFATPMAFIFIAIFVALNGAFTFYIGRFFDRGQATLEAFFSFHPWLYLLLVPAVAMRLWAEDSSMERATITIFCPKPENFGSAIMQHGLQKWNPSLASSGRHRWFG